MFSRHVLFLSALAVCVRHGAAFVGRSPAAGALAGTGYQADQRLAARAIARGTNVHEKFAGPLLARGGQLLLRKSVAVPLDVSEPVQGSLAVPPQQPQKKPGLLNAYLRALDNRPIVTKVITSGVICGVGDILAQALAFKTAATNRVTLGAFVGALELQRFAIYGLLGAFWIAPVVHYWFNALESATKSKKGPPTTFAGKMGKALKMMAIDQSIGAPVVNAGFMFLFTLSTALCTGVPPVPAGRKAFVMVRDNIWSTLLVCWKIWPVANLINFAFVPASLRVLFLNFIGLGWNIFLSAAVN